MIKIRVATLAFSIVLAMLSAAATVHGQPGLAQPGGQGDWSQPTIIYEEVTPDYKNVYHTIVADSFGNLHLIWHRRTDLRGENCTVMYSRWNGHRWTTPVDVLVAPLGENLNAATFTVDARGRLHAGFGGQRPYSLYYSWTWFDQADNAANWSRPLAIGPRPFALTIMAEGENNLHILYTDAGEKVYYLHSTDAGESWLPHVLISPAPPDGSVSDPRFTIGPEGIFHAVWTEGPQNGYPPLAVVYAQSRDRGASWSPPLRLFGADVGEPSIAVAGDGTVHVFGNGRAGVGGRFHTWSKDGGLTWSEVENLAPGDTAGLTGPIALALDSKGKLHILYVTEKTGIMYTYWTGENLALPITLVPYEPGIPPRDMNWWGEGAVLTVAYGNQLHVVVPAAYGRKIWHTWKVIENTKPIAPQATPVRLTPTVFSPPTPTALPSPIKWAFNTPNPNINPVMTITVNEGGATLAIAVGVIPSIVLIVLLVLGSQLSRRR